MEYAFAIGLRSGRGVAIVAGLGRSEREVSERLTAESAWRGKAGRGRVSGLGRSLLGLYTPWRRASNADVGPPGCSV
jgi:hypothetical protein